VSRVSAVTSAVRRKYTFYRRVRRAPENLLVRRRHAVAPLIGRVPSRIRGVASVDEFLRSLVFVNDLRRLNDVLSLTAASGRYWVWSGLLLGWAREGRVLRHDLRDADFAYDEKDESVILEGLEQLMKAGFRRGFSFRNNDGVLTERTLIRHGARFEFFRMSSVAAEWEYNIYVSEEDPLTQMTARLPRQELERFEFLDRSWSKVKDHERELSILYGNWKISDPEWSYLNSGGVIDRVEWTGG
jgi:hypothetical protein